MCVSGIESTYLWEGKINRDPEILMIMKTRTSLTKELVEFVQKNHPYDVRGPPLPSPFSHCHSSVTSEAQSRDRLSGTCSENIAHGLSRPQVPEVICTDVKDGLPAYLQWVADSTKEPKA